MIDSTPLRSGLGRRCCARSEGEPCPYHIESQQNNVADVGATALAEALKATVCRFIGRFSRHVLLMTTDVTSQCGMKSWHRQVVVQFVYKDYVFL